MKYPLFLDVFVLLSISCKPSESVQVTIKQGTLEGTVSTSRNGTKFYSFYSIPFAKPPVGKLRFQPPKEPDNWEGVREAKKLPPVCIQSQPTMVPFSASTNPILGEEDCLYLNVFTPQVASQSSLPVMVYIHGGAFYCGGSGMIGPEYFMDHPIVIVTIHYRLGIFGFLSAVDEILPGNYGMKDQSAALRWVQENIVVFSGDPKRVTIVGESAGAGSVSLHMYSPLSTGLFHGAISQSGSALALWAIIDSETAKNRAQAAGVLSGCPELDSRALVECLRKIPAQQLVSTHDKFFVYDVIPSVLFGPVVEPKSVPDAFLIENPWRQNVINSVPLLTGVNADDGNFLTIRLISLPMVLKDFTLYYERLLPMTLLYYSKMDSRKLSAMTEALKKFYFGDEDISLKTKNNLKEMFTDGAFAATSLEAARRVNNTTFFYLYDHKNEHSFDEHHGNVTADEYGVSHADDLISLFNLRNVFPFIRSPASADYVVSQRMVKYWVNFIKNGEPNGEGMNIWTPFKSHNFAYLHIKTAGDDMKEKLRFKNYMFWKDNVFPALNFRN